MASFARALALLLGVQPLSTYFADSELVNWQGLFAPAGTPRPIVDRMNAAVVKVLALPEVRTRMADIGLTATASSPAELEQTIRVDQAMNRDLIKRIGLKLD